VYVLNVNHSFFGWFLMKQCIAQMEKYSRKNLQFFLELKEGLLMSQR